MTLVIAYDANGNPYIADSTEIKAQNLTSPSAGSISGPGGMIGAIGPRKEVIPIGSTSPQSNNIKPQSLGQITNPFTGTEIKIEAKPKEPEPVSIVYNPSSGTQTVQTFENGKLEEKAVFYGYSPTTIGGSSLTATSQKPKSNLIELNESNYYPSYKKIGLGAAPQLFLTGAAMTIPSLIQTGVEVIKTPFEVAKFGPGIVGAKITKGVSDIKRSWTEQPGESFTMLLGSVAFTAGLQKFGSIIPKGPIEVGGQAKIQIVPSENPVVTMGKGSGKFAAPDINTGFTVKFDAVSKQFGMVDASAARGSITAITPRNILSKITGSKVTTVRETSFAKFAVSRDITPNIQVGGGITATSLKNIAKSGQVTKNLISGPSVDIYQSISKSKVANVLSTTEIIKSARPGIGSIGGTSGSVFKTVSMGKLGGSIGSKVGQTAASIPKPIIPFGIVTKTGQTAILESTPKITMRTEQKTVPIVIEKEAQKMKTPAVQKTALISKQKTLPPMLSPITVQDMAQESKKVSIQTPVSLNIQTTGQKQISPTVQKTMTPTKTINIIPPVITPPIFSSAGIGFSSEGSRIRKVQRNLRTVRLVKKYTPSVAGILLGRTVKRAPKGRLTGLEIRPYVSGIRKNRRIIR